MNKISRLVENYSRHIAVPWRDDTAPAQRVIFCVYPEYNELRLRLRLDEFETVNPTEDDFIRGDNGPVPEIEFDKDSYSANGNPPERPTSVDRPTSPPPPKSGDKK